jgi:hypothetical protein
LSELEKCGLKDTRATAKPLERLTLESYVRTGTVTLQSQAALMSLMALIRASLENELKKRG